MPSSNPRTIFYLLCVASVLAVTKTDPEAVHHHSAPAEDIDSEAIQQLALFNYGLNRLQQEDEARQVTTQSNGTHSEAVSPAIPCTCDRGVCKCCVGLLAMIGMNSCTEVVYRPDEFSFELRFRVNNNVWFQRKISGQNPPPVCIRPPRFSFARACVRFSEIWFLGRNMHTCMHISASFQGYELFERDFDCLLFGDQGVKIVKPEIGYPVPVEVDDDTDDIEDYDENVVRH